MLPSFTMPPGARVPDHTAYYEKYGMGTDALVRCTECQRLVTHAEIQQLGCCPCGCRRMREITTLSEQEEAAIRSGAIDFPYREEFLKEFTGVA